MSGEDAENCENDKRNQEAEKNFHIVALVY